MTKSLLKNKKRKSHNTTNYDSQSLNFKRSLVKFRALNKYVIMTFSLRRILDAKKYYDKKSPKFYFLVIYGIIIPGRNLKPICKTIIEV